MTERTNENFTMKGNRMHYNADSFNPFKTEFHIVWFDPIINFVIQSPENHTKHMSRESQKILYILCPFWLHQYLSFDV